MGVVLFATTIASAQQDMKAKNILDEVSKKAQSYKTISADFILSKSGL